MTKTYETRGVAEPHNSRVYAEYMAKIGLKEHDRTSLISRGLTIEHIKAAGYASKGVNQSNDTVLALGHADKNFNLDGVPGFYIDDRTGQRAQTKVSGILIPVCDMNGNISSILVRNDRAKVGKSGKIENKYVAFSSAGFTKGNKVRQTTHCPRVKGIAKDVCGATARLTEGVLKADVATVLDDVYCYGMQGLNIADDLAVIVTECEVQEILIALDAGEDESIDMMRAKANLIKFCTKMGLDYKVEVWDKRYGKGIDDVLKNGHKDKIRYLDEKEIELILESVNELDPNNGDWVFCIKTETFINIHTFDQLTKSQFQVKFRFEKLDDVTKFLVCDFKIVDDMTYLPKGEKFFKEDEKLLLNVWRDPKIIPLEGDISILMSHINLMFPDEKERNMVLDWLAFNIQRQGEKILWALVILGDYGTGKSMIGLMMEKLLGTWNISRPTNEQLQENFTGWQLKASLIIIEELMQSGRLDLVNKLKPMITQPTTRIRQMHREAYDYPNRFNILAFTNFINAIYIDDKDRRYGIVKVADISFNNEYYKPIWTWLAQPKSIQHLLHFFLNRDISHFVPYARPPMTQAKKEMADMSRSQLEEWVADGIEQKVWPFNGEIVVIPHLKDKKVCPSGLDKVSNQKWAEALKKSGAIQYKNQIELTDKSRPKVWLIGDKKHILVNASSTELRKLYEQPQSSNSQTPPTAENNVLEFNQGVNPLEATKPINPIEENEPL